jgi:SAM-dependent methyltransferase
MRREFALVFRAKPYLAWFVEHKAPVMHEWVNALVSEHQNEPLPSEDDLKKIESALICSMEDWTIYVTTPDDYHNQPFNTWDEAELTGLTGWTGKTVIDIGSGTGKQAFAVAPLCATLFCVEPVFNLRKYLRTKAANAEADNVFVVDGLLEAIPFPNGFADASMCGHVFGDMMEQELSELERITKRDGMMILCPGNVDADNEYHQFLIGYGYSWGRFLEPGETVGSSWKRKHWRTKP